VTQESKINTQLFISILCRTSLFFI